MNKLTLNEPATITFDFAVCKREQTSMLWWTKADKDGKITTWLSDKDYNRRMIFFHLDIYHCCARPVKCKKKRSTLILFCNFFCQKLHEKWKDFGSQWGWAQVPGAPLDPPMYTAVWSYKDLFTRTVSVSVSVTVKFTLCVYGDGQNGLVCALWMRDEAQQDT